MIYWFKHSLMIQKARCSVMMEAGMKASGKMVKGMAKVRKSDLLYDLLIWTLFDDSKGKWFGDNGRRYEG